jgi:hypothetical protein
MHLNSTSWGNDFAAASIYAQTENASTGASALVFANNIDGSSASATERMRISANGNVGIGTTNPNGLLEIYAGASGALGGHIILNNNGLAVDSSTALIFQDGNSSSVRGAISTTTENSPYYGKMEFKTGADSYASLTTKMIITGIGNVGIGTSSPSQKLDTVGYINSTKYITPEQEPFTLTVNYSGDVIEGPIDGDVSQWDLVSLDPNGTWYQTNDANINSTYLLGIYLGDPGSGNLILLEGHITVNDSVGGSPNIQGLATGIPIYIRDGGKGTMSTTTPTTSGNYVRICGHAYYKSGGISDTYIMKFRPSNDWVQL